jgi:hypothetical protein
MSALARAFLDELEPDDLEQLARALAPYLPAIGAERATDGWLSTREAAAYAGCTVDALHKAIARQEVRFEQNGPGAKCYFRPAWLDAWRAR